MAARKPRAQAPADNHMVHELILHIDNTQSNHNQAQAMGHAIAVHACRGNWSKEKAIKGFMNVVDRAAREYAKQFSMNSAAINRATRTEAAKAYVDDLRSNLNRCRTGACYDLPAKTVALMRSGKCAISKPLAGASKRRRR